MRVDCTSNKKTKGSESRLRLPLQQVLPELKLIEEQERKPSESPERQKDKLDWRPKDKLRPRQKLKEKDVRLPKLKSEEGVLNKSAERKSD